MTNIPFNTPWNFGAFNFGGLNTPFNGVPFGFGGSPFFGGAPINPWLNTGFNSGFNGGFNTGFGAPVQAPVNGFPFNAVQNTLPYQNTPFSGVPFNGFSPFTSIPFNFNGFNGINGFGNGVNPQNFGQGIGGFPFAGINGFVPSNAFGSIFGQNQTTENIDGVNAPVNNNASLGYIFPINGVPFGFINAQQFGINQTQAA